MSCEYSGASAGPTVRNIDHLERGQSGHFHGETNKAKAWRNKKEVEASIHPGLDQLAKYIPMMMLPKLYHRIGREDKVASKRVAILHSHVNRRRQIGQDVPDRDVLCPDTSLNVSQNLGPQRRLNRCFLFKKQQLRRVTPQRHRSLLSVVLRGFHNFFPQSKV